MLITTRRKRRWSVPKGSPMRNKKPHHTAALEAYDEAGLVGVIATRAMGSFKHRKRKRGRKRTMDVSVFPMKVHGQERWWPEKGERQAIWVSAETAARLVHKAELRRLIVRFAAQTERSAPLLLSGRRWDRDLGTRVRPDHSS